MPSESPFSTLLPTHCSTASGTSWFVPRDQFMALPSKRSFTLSAWVCDRHFSWLQCVLYRKCLIQMNLSCKINIAAIIPSAANKFFIKFQTNVLVGDVSRQSFVNECSIITIMHNIFHWYYHSSITKDAGFCVSFSNYL